MAIIKAASTPSLRDIIAGEIIMSVHDEIINYC